MKPETAVRLVSEFAAITKAIKGCKLAIGKNLDFCNGLKGFRRELEGGMFVTDRANSDQDTHLKHWYTPKRGYDGEGEYIHIGEDQKVECPHCYAAHQLIQKRKEYRKQLASIKGSMTRFG